MKNLLLLFLTFLGSLYINAQDWNTAGNTVAVGAVLGTNNNQPLNIRTNNTPRLEITPFGSFQWFGSNATAFRSMALGDNTTASGENAFSGGLNSQATFSNSFSFGVNNQSNNVGAVTFGNSNVASGSNAMAIGSGNQSTGDESFAFGSGNQASGEGSFAFGPQFTQATGNGSVAGGFDVFSTNIGAFGFGENVQSQGAFSLGIGQGIVSSGNNAIALGVLNFASGNRSVSIGTRVEASAEGSFVLGHSDTTSGWFLNNNITNSLMVGFDSDISTFFVGQSSGQGTTGNIGIGELAAMGGQPQNKLEITSDGNSPTPSGLRFTNLTSAAATLPNPGAGVLSVDPNGDVIYVDAPIPTGGVGNFCGQPQNPLTADFEIPLSGNDYYFSGQGNQTNNVSVGFPCGVQPLAKLHVFQTAVNQLFTPTIGISTAGRFDNVSDNLISFGVYGSSSGAAQINVGVYGEATNGATNYAGFFNGDVFRTGTDNFTSDINLKQNIESVQNAMEIVKQLNPVTFEFDNSSHPNMHLADGNQFGFVAQEVESILPELVKNETFPAEYDSIGNVVTPEFGFKSLNYIAFVPILTKGLKEQQSQIDSLENELNQKDSLLNNVNNRLTQLENCLGNILPFLCQINNSSIQQNNEEKQNDLFHQLSVELFDGVNIILEQNVPNPFAEKAVINFSIPESVREAKLIFYNNQGRTIKEVKIDERGPGQLNVFGAELSKGIYSYTLICDGQVISSKKMVKQ